VVNPSLSQPGVNLKTHNQADIFRLVLWLCLHLWAQWLSYHRCNVSDPVGALVGGVIPQSGVGRSEGVDSAEEVSVEAALVAVVMVVDLAEGVAVAEGVAALPGVGKQCERTNFSPKKRKRRFARR
jgi:hypothetical protein